MLEQQTIKDILYSNKNNQSNYEQNLILYCVRNQAQNEKSIKANKKMSKKQISIDTLFLCSIDNPIFMQSSLNSQPIKLGHAL